ncbi:hypothetical protein PENTCL1PPCAC_32, partial [Pristionchus entomophagus]
VYAMELNCLEMLMRSFHSLFSTRAFASARKCIAVERVGRRGDVALVSIADPSLGDIPHEICEILVAHDSDVSIRSTIVALTSSLTSLPLKSYGSFSKVSCEIPIPLPAHSDTAEYMAYIVATQEVHPMFHEELLTTLDSFIRREEEEMEEERDEAVLDEALREGRSVDVERWSAAIANQSLDALEEAVRLADSFGEVMRDCDPVRMEAAMRRESEMAREVTRLIALRDSELEGVRQKAETLMEKKTMGEGELRELSAFNEEMRYIHDSYVAELRMVGVRQRSEFKEMIRRLTADATFVPKVLAPEGEENGQIVNDSAEVHPRKMEESFTIYLGAQLKTMHNARIVVGSELGEDRDWNQPHVRLQASMSLYRRELAATVLLVGRDPKWHLQRRSDFARLCERSTELHFAPLEQQLQAVSEAARRANGRRKEGGSSDDDCFATGDVYMTRHSNLCNVHIVYHLVVDEAEQYKDINSRHPYLNGVRNIVRMASRFGVTTLSLPMLFTDCVHESMTVAWSARRAELVFKCVKGYLMEICSTGWSSVSLGGASLSRASHYNINFVLPRGISSDVYSHIVALFPTIFHLVPSVTA